MAVAGFICGAAKGTTAKPYRCICCRVAYANPDAVMVSICVFCMAGNPRCAECRKRGIFVSDCRVGTHWAPDGSVLPEYDPQGGTGHRLARYRGSVGVMNCGKRIPIKHFGNGIAVVPPCRFCWPGGIW